MASTWTAPAAVIGGGPAGLVAALALAYAGVRAALIAPPPPATSAAANRTTALMLPSVIALEALGVWPACRDHAAPLRVMRVVDDTGRLWRAPEVRFESSEIGLTAFAWNIDNRRLVAALRARAAAQPLLTVLSAPAVSLQTSASGVTVALAGGGSVRCRLVVGADGHNSLCRAAAGIAVDSRSYPQTALTFTLAHTRPHDDVSTEFHTANGPFTLVPLPGHRSSLVWVAASGEAPRLAALARAALDDEVERRSHSILGKVRVESPCGMFPLRVARARTLGAGRITLVGEAAHLVPPIGAQGFNLGLRDALTLAEVAGAMERRGGDIGEATIPYGHRRRADVAGRTLAVDILNRSLLSDMLAVQGLRGLGLYALGHIGPLRRTAMREGLSPRSGLPALMRGA